MGKSGTRFGIAEDVCIEDEICILIFDFLARYKANAESLLFVVESGYIQEEMEMGLEITGDRCHLQTLLSSERWSNL